VYVETAEITGKTPDDEWIFVKTNMVILIVCICESIIVLAASLQATTLYQLSLQDRVKIYHTCLMLSSFHPGRVLLTNKQLFIAKLH
jgi:hypothetical protein